ncbi:MAG TPA: hypothetical protein P5568_05785 [Acidobacteriota bacterium]|nr:hypothetical protein [Acidobacteriota bacterium]HRV07963.1 hypothetical protein [Acidobacteriota bacterium]
MQFEKDRYEFWRNQDTESSALSVERECDSGSSVGFRLYGRFRVSFGGADWPGRSAGVQVAKAPEYPQWVRLVRRAVVDRDGFGTEAFSLLLPPDWDFQGEL